MWGESCLAPNDTSSDLLAGPLLKDQMRVSMGTANCWRPRLLRCLSGGEHGWAGRQMFLTLLASSSYFDDMSAELREGRRLVAAAADPDPEVGFAAVVALRGLVEVLEALQVDNARARGWSWRDIARRLGVTKQAVHYKHAMRFRGR